MTWRIAHGRLLMQTHLPWWRMHHPHRNKIKHITNELFPRIKFVICFKCLRECSSVWSHFCSSFKARVIYPRFSEPLFATLTFAEHLFCIWGRWYFCSSKLWQLMPIHVLYPLPEPDRHASCRRPGSHLTGQWLSHLRGEGLVGMASKLFEKPALLIGSGNLKWHLLMLETAEDSSFLQWGQLNAMDPAEWPTLGNGRGTVGRCAGPKWSKMVHMTILVKMTLFRTGFWPEEVHFGQFCGFFPG